ncbi:hypothetical protein F4677DRAFT_421849 [Hypoxylon crocopeplum]|nr:hypothetical protein F4677DRAFT_421849 [Hypoxylon crocopeplum]
MSVLEGNFLLDGGAERLIEQWKASVEQLISQRNGVPRKVLESDYNDFLYKSGSAHHCPKKVLGVSDYEYYRFTYQLAPIESDGLADKEEWNLFEEFLPKMPSSVEGLDETDSLSSVLNHWSHLRVRSPHVGIGKEKGLKKEMGEKAARAIRRLSEIPMLACQLL